MVRSLIGLFSFRSNPVSKVYQHRSRNDGILEVTLSTGSLRKNCKNTAVGELTPDPFPQLANGTGPNRTHAHWKFTTVYHQRHHQRYHQRVSAGELILVPRTLFFTSASCVRLSKLPLGFGAQLIGPIQLHVKRQNSSICKFSQDIAWTFFCL